MCMFSYMHYVYISLACLVPAQSRGRRRIPWNWRCRWLWSTMWALGIKSNSSAKASIGLNCSATRPTSRLKQCLENGVKENDYTVARSTYCYRFANYAWVWGLIDDRMCGRWIEEWIDRWLGPCMYRWL